MSPLPPPPVVVFVGLVCCVVALCVCVLTQENDYVSATTMPPKADPAAADEELSPEELEQLAAAQQHELQRRAQALAATESHGRRIVEEMAAVDRKFIVMDKAACTAAAAGDEGRGGTGLPAHGCNAAGRFYLYVKMLTGNRAFASETVELHCTAADSVDTVKELVCKKLGGDGCCPPPEMQVLSYRGAPFATGTLAENEVPPNATLHLSLAADSQPSEDFTPPPVRCLIKV